MAKDGGAPTIHAAKLRGRLLDKFKWEVMTWRLSIIQEEQNNIIEREFKSAREEGT